MSGWGSWLASQLNLDPTEFDRWQFIWAKHPSDWMLALVLFCATVFIALSWRASRTIEKSWQRALLGVLRLAAVAIIAAIAFDPAVEFLKTRHREEAFVVLIDASRSMTLKTGDDKARIDIVKSYLKDNQEQLDQLEKRYQVQYVTFDGAAHVTTRKEIPAIKANQGQTLIGESMDDVIRSMAASPPVGILLLSDGADRGRVRAALQSEGSLAPVPVYPVLLPESNPPDAAVVEIATDPYAFVRNGLDVTAKIRMSGLKIRTVNATLRIDGQVVTTQSVTLPEKGDTAEVKFRTTPQRVGRFVYSVEIPTFPNEAVVENNKRNAVVKVVRDRVRVLHVVGEPSWDERFLRRYLEKDPNVDLISFMILRTREDLDATPEGELSLIPFPTKELFTDELKTFDLVIFQNFDYRPYFDFFPGQLLDNVRKFVEEDGGGFVMIGGDKSFASGGYNGSPLEPLLPVDLSPGPVIDLNGFEPELTADGTRHPITGLDLPPAEAEAVWKSLPAAVGTNVVGQSKPGAVTLLRHNRLRAGGAGMPVLAAMDYGKGRSMALTVDSSWTWSFLEAGKGGSSGYFQRFWNNAIRWLVHDPDFGRVRLESDRDNYDPGEPVLARCTVLDENYRPAAKSQVDLAWKNREASAWKSLATQEVEAGVYAAEGIPDAGGVYDLKCSAKVKGKVAGEESILVNIDSLGEEMKDTTVHNDVLKALAARSGGKTVRLADSDWLDTLGLNTEAAFEIVGRRIERIWDNAFVLSLVALLLSLEWFLRRRWGGL